MNHTQKASKSQKAGIRNGKKMGKKLFKQSRKNRRTMRGGIRK